MEAALLGDVENGRLRREWFLRLTKPIMTGLTADQTPWSIALGSEENKMLDPRHPWSSAGQWNLFQYKKKELWVL